MPLNAKPAAKSSFLLLALSHGITTFGDSFQFMASVSMLIKLTSSGLSTGFGIICAPLPGLILSPFAGVLGDRLREKYLLAGIDFLRGLSALLFLLAGDKYQVYALLLLRAVLDIFYSPPRKKIVARILKSEDIVSGNSILYGVSGAAYLLGPVAAGIVISEFSTAAAFIINSVCFFISSLLLPMIVQGAPASKKSTKSLHIKVLNFKLNTDFLRGISYYRTVPEIRSLVTSAAVLCFATSAVNIAFYPFAFDVLKVNSKSWGLMMSVFYGTNLAALLIPELKRRGILKHPYAFIHIQFAITGAVWLMYGLTGTLVPVMLLQLTEGTAAAFCGVVISSSLQVEASKMFMARVMGISDVFNNLGKITGIGLAYAVLNFMPPHVVFAGASLTILGYTAVKILKRLTNGGSSSRRGLRP